MSSDEKQGLFHQRMTGETTQLFTARERDRKKRNRKALCWCLIFTALVILFFGVVVGVAIGVQVVLNRLPSEPYDRAVALLDKSPLIDG